MTAIAGLIHFDQKPITNETLERMVYLLKPYGRDSQQSYLDSGYGFLRTLLRITPEDDFDQQPLRHEASDTLVLFDGRLDNRDELCQSLDIHSSALPHMADSQLVLSACLKWGREAPSHLLGDFALACWQPKKKKIWLARDPFGTRPLFWYQREKLFAFASLPKALFAIPGVPKVLCEERLADRLMLLPATAAESFYEDVYRVEPGQLLTVENGHMEARYYHRFELERKIQLASDEEYLEAFSEQLELAVARRLRSSGPIGSQLSSGFDSSTITALAARQLAGRDQRITAYTAIPRLGFSDPDPKGRHSDESVGAAALAARFANIDHVLVRPSGAPLLDNWSISTEMGDRPIHNLCNEVWINAINREMADRNAKVLLIGQMGNMTISYTGMPYLANLFGRGKWVSWWREASALKQVHPKRRWRGLLANSIGPYLPASLWSYGAKLRHNSNGLFDYSAIHPEFYSQMQHRISASNWDMSYRPWANGRKMRIEMLTRHDVSEVQMMANFHGFEKRDPTCDRHLIEFCLAIPESQYLNKGKTRWLLHRMMDDVLPPEITQATTKGIQAVDWYEAAGAALPQIREQLQQWKAHGSVGKYLDLDSLLQSLDDWPDSGWNTPLTMQKYRLKLLRGLGVGMYIQKIEEGDNDC